MAYENLCMYCFEDNGGQDVCPHCGRDARAAVPQIQLLPGTLLYNERFLAGRALGQDASGIVYAALDTKRGVKIRIREFLPRDSARRLNSGEVVPESGAEDAFETGLKKLRASVEGVEDPAKRHFFFEENGTGYIAQRRNAAADGGERDEERQGPRLALIIGVAAALVLAVAVGVIMLVNYLTNRTDTKLDQPRTSSEDIWTPPESPTPTPYAQATFGTITDPEQSWMEYTNPDLKGDKSDYAKPTPVPTAENGFDISKTINAKSSTGTIKQLQKLLTNLGWLETGNVTGKYDAATKQAIKDFQQYMNDTYAISPKLSVDGVAGPKTLAWLVKTDVSVKPTPTPAPITPSPTQAGKVIDENSPAEEIRYVQEQLIILGVLDQNGATGIYDNATRSAVLYFQRRVNDLQGYDALDETGTVNGNTLAYLDYYVELWLNRPTPTPGASATPAPTATAPTGGGVVVDENAAPESIKFVQQMLIALGYLDGKADGAYGAKTVDAVKGFQQFIIAQHGNVLAVTGKADETTLNYLEYYYENLATPAPTATPTAAPTAAAPQITVAGATAHENGVYYVGTEGVKISWKADGAVSGYGVYLADDGGKVVRQIEDTQYTSLNLPQSYLTTNGIFTFTVVAVGAGADDAPYSSVSLAIAGATATPTPTAAPSLKPQIGVSGALGYLNGVYQIGEAGAGLSWTSAGASGYSLYLTDADSEIIASNKNTALTAYQVDAATMIAGVEYTFTVVAIPQGGVEKDGEYSSVKLTLAEGVGVTPEPSRTPAADVGAPVISVTGQLGLAEGIYYWVGEENLNIAWTASGHVSGYSMYIQNEKGTVISSLKDSDETGMSVDPKTMTLGETYTITIVAIPDGGGEEHGQNAAIRIELYDGQTPQPTEPPVGQVSAPQIAVSGQKDFADGVYYADKDALAFSWSAQGDVASYDVKLAGSDGTVVGDAKGTNKTSLVVDPNDMAEGVVYTLTINAVPKNGTSEDGASASVAMAKYVRPAVGTPEISVDGADEQGGVYYIGAEAVTLRWTAQNAGSYSIYLIDSSEKVINARAGIADTSVSLSPGTLAPGQMYAFKVTAIPEGGAEKDGKSASVALARAEEQVPEVGTPQIAIDGADGQGGVYYIGTEAVTLRWTAQNAGSYSIYLIDSAGKVINSRAGIADTSVPLSPGTLAPGELYAFKVTAIPEGGAEEDGKSASVALARAAEEVPEVGTPSISVSGEAGREGGVYYLGAEGMTVGWSADNAALYSAYLYDEGGTAIKSAPNIADTSIPLTNSKMKAGERYTMTVIAMPKGGAEKDGKSASIQVMLYEEPIVEIGTPSIKVSGHLEYANETYWAGADTLKLSWSADNASLYSIYLTDSDGKIDRKLEDIADTSTTLSPSNLKAGEIYTFTVVAMDANGKESGSPYASVMLGLAQEEEEPPAPDYIDKNSPTEAVYNMQMALYNLGWLTGDSGATPGKFDAATIQAVYDFQVYVSTEGINPELSVIDPSSNNPTVDAATLSTLMDTGNPVHKP